MGGGVFFVYIIVGKRVVVSIEFGFMYVGGGYSFDGI